MKIHPLTQGLLLCLTLAAPAASIAQVTFSINVGPPPLMFEPVPYIAHGYAWAPGYWAWNHDRHIWIRGRTIYERPGYRWEPDRWEQRGATYYRRPGNWTRDNSFAPPRAQPSPRAQQPRRATGKSQKRGPLEDERGNNGRR